MPIPIMAGLAVAQAGLGAYQAIKGSKKKADRPTKKVSQETKDIASTYGQLAQGGVPGAKQEIENIQKSRQNTLAQAGRYTSSGANMLAMIGQSGAQESDAMQSAEIKRQQNKMSLINQYMNAKKMLGAEKQDAWQYNQADKYEEDASAKSAMVEGGIQNMFGALSTASAIGETGGLGKSAGKSVANSASNYAWMKSRK